jgi:catechol 2,3-dioxygenase-like lactoylglutathione lyase family enzyme
MDLRLVSAVIFVKDIKASRHFYEEVLGQQVLMDHGPNVGFAGGFALWQIDHASQVIFQRVSEEQPARSNKAELYFETGQIEEACQRLEAAGVEWIHPVIEQPWGQRVVRFYDADGHIIEFGEPMPAVITRFLGQGMSLEEVAQRTSMPLEIVSQIAAA